MNTMTKEERHKADTKRYYDCTVEQAEELQKCINQQILPDDEELMYFFPDDEYFDAIEWINAECLEADSHDLLLATGGPAYGVSLVHGAPVFWFQDWFTTKECIQFGGLAFDFYLMIFGYLEELDC